MNQLRRRIQTAMQSGGGAAAFSPTDIAGLQIWLDASQIVGLNDGDAVATWSDLSGNGYNATQGTASKRPTYQTSEINGKPCVRFDGVDDFLRCSSFSQAQPLTVLCVGNSISGGRFFDGATSRLLIGYQGGTDVIFFAGTVNAQFSGYALPWPWRYYTGVFNAASSQQFVNGASVGTANPGNQSLVDLHVGCGYYLGVPAEFLSGDIAELIIYNSSLSAGNLALLHAYTASKYGL